MDFFSRIIRVLLDSKNIGADDTVLVVCGGSYDASVLRQFGFSRVTITNLDQRYDGRCEPYTWTRQDAENLTFEDGAFDWAIVHAGLHHCGSPHRALLEMCRVARKGAIVIEARDSALIRLAARFGLTVDYEIDAVIDNGLTQGGVRNSAVPNFVYRWTEREVRKTIEAAYPHRFNRLRFFYDIRLPAERLARGSAPKRALATALGILASGLQRLFPRQCNQFGFVVMHTQAYKPWMNEHGTALRSAFERRLGDVRQ
jgi:SAM-dependent methyltransferase